MTALAWGAFIAGLLAIPVFDLDTRRRLARWWLRQQVRPRRDALPLSPSPIKSIPNFGSHARTDTRSVAERRAWLEAKILEARLRAPPRPFVPRAKGKPPGQTVPESRWG